MFRQWVNIAVIVFFLLLSAVSVYYLFQLEFNYDFEAFFPRHSEEIEFYNRYRDHFGPDDDYILIGLSNGNNGAFEREFLGKIHAFTQAADTALPNIINASSLTTLTRPVIAAGNVMHLEVLHQHEPSKYRADSQKIMQDERLRNRYISAGGNVLTVILTTDGVLNLAEATDTDKALNELLDDFDFEESYMAGRSYYQSLFAKRAKDEFVLYTSVSALLILIILYVIFRKPWGIIVSFSSVIIGMLIFIGFLGIRGKPLDPMSNLFPILMIIVGVSDVIHLLTKYTDEQRKGISQKQAILVTIKEIGLATLLTSITTAIAFASLITSSVPPIRHFGSTAAIGVLIAYVTVILFSSSLMSFFPAKKLIRLHVKNNAWDKLMQWFYVTTLKKQKIIIWSSIGLFCLLIWGISMVSTDTHLESNFPRNDKSRQDFRLFEDEFGGVRNFEMAVLPKVGHQLTDEGVMKQVDAVERYLQSFEPLTSPATPATLFKSINQAMHGDNPEYYRIPTDSATYERVKSYAARAPKSMKKQIIGNDGSIGRMMLRFKDIGSDSSKVIRQQVDDWIGLHIDTSMVTFRQTGTALLFDTNSQNVRLNMFAGLGLAFLLVSLLMAALFKNLKMVIVSLVPNVIPLLVSGALIGFLQIELDAATSVIFAIAFGIAVDDTIHFLSKFRLEVDKGFTVQESIRTTYRESGKAISLTSVILFFGFVMLVTSYYPPTFYIGLLISITLISALLADLFIIPVLIYRLIGTGELKMKSWFRKILKIRN
jgi:predicted RND superfamily exporter protein